MAEEVNATVLNANMKTREGQHQYTRAQVGLLEAGKVALK
jgi:hypothetical protein